MFHRLLAGGIISADDRALAHHSSARDRQTNKQTIEISMTIRLATYDDLPAIMPVIDAAREMSAGAELTVPRMNARLIMPAQVRLAVFFIMRFPPLYILRVYILHIILPHFL